MLNQEERYAIFTTAFSSMNISFHVWSTATNFHISKDVCDIILLSAFPDTTEMLSFSLCERAKEVDFNGSHLPNLNALMIEYSNLDRLDIPNDVELNNLMLVMSGITSINYGGSEKSLVSLSVLEDIEIPRVVTSKMMGISDLSLRSIDMPNLPTLPVLKSLSLDIVGAATDISIGDKFPNLNMVTLRGCISSVSIPQNYLDGLSISGVCVNLNLEDVAGTRVLLLECSGCNSLVIPESIGEVFIIDD